MQAVRLSTPDAYCPTSTTTSRAAALTWARSNAAARYRSTAFGRKASTKPTSRSAARHDRPESMSKWVQPLPRLHDITAVIFDLDGVLVDSEPIHFRAANRILAHYGAALS